MPGKDLFTYLNKENIKNIIIFSGVSIKNDLPTKQTVFSINPASPEHGEKAGSFVLPLTGRR